MKKTAYIGLLCALAIILGYVEMLLPVFPFAPGVKLGITNLVTVFLLYSFTYKEAALVSCIRIVCIGFMFGNLFSIVYSLAGAFLSLLCMTLAKKIKGLAMAGSRKWKCFFLFSDIALCRNSNRTFNWNCIFGNL